MEIPGFIDLQVNGYKDVNFSSPDLTEERFIFACKEIISHGTAAFLPTVITSSENTYIRNLKLIAKAIRHEELKNSVLGIHLEGPFISDQEGAVGAHNPDWVKKPDLSLLDKLYEWTDGQVKLLTIAPEVEGAKELCQHARKLDISVSLGHHLGTEEDVEILASSGARALTHLGNGIPKVLPRHNNPLWAGLANDSLIAMIISDGHHLPPSIIKTIIRTKGVSKVVVVSDASPIAGLPPGRYNTLGNEAVLEESGHLYNPETGYLVGSASMMTDCMNHLSSLNLLSFDELLAVGYSNPLKLIGIDPEEAKFKDTALEYDEDKNKFVLTS